MTNEMLNNLEKRGYVFGNHKGIEVPYDAETDSIVMKEYAFKWLLRQIPSDMANAGEVVVINGKEITDNMVRTNPDGT